MPTITKISSKDRTETKFAVSWKNLTEIKVLSTVRIIWI